MAVDAIIQKGNKILLIKRKCEPEKGKWALPGGHINWDETLENAVIREVNEETNLKVINSCLVAIYSSHNRHPEQMLAAVYVTEVAGSPLAGSDAADIGYFHAESLPENLAFDHREIIKDYYAKNR